MFYNLKYYKECEGCEFRATIITPVLCWMSPLSKPKDVGGKCPLFKEEEIEIIECGKD